MTFFRRPLSQGDLDMFVAAHERLVEGRPGGRRLMLKFVDLNGLDLSGRNLTEADFTGCALENAKLVGARMNGAVLFCADLRGADFTGAQLVRADLRGACLRGPLWAGQALLQPGTCHVGSNPSHRRPVGTPR